MTRINSLLLTLTILLITNVAIAARCPGSMTNVNADRVSVTASPPTAIAFIFQSSIIQQGMGCNYTKIGGSFAPSLCFGGTVGYGSDNMQSFKAIWASATALASASPSAGCLFTCPGVGSMGTASPTCFVRALDGLPVELMQFSVDE